MQVLNEYQLKKLIRESDMLHHRLVSYLDDNYYRLSLGRRSRLKKLIQRVHLRCFRRDMRMSAFHRGSTIIGFGSGGWDD